jgi:hypothetical protein
MGVALRHDRRLMPQEPLHLIQVNPSLNHPRREGMAKIVKMEIVSPLVQTFSHPTPEIPPWELSR